MTTELEVMKKIVDVLEPLDPAARTRVVAWIVSALNIQTSGSGIATVAKPLSPDQGSPESDFSTFAEFFHATGPKTEREKALVAAFWIQRMSGKDQFVSQQVNTELKNIGYGVSNITDALGQLIDARPSLAIQLTKSGQSRQARKTYKVTDAGVRYLKAMLDAAK
jgi:hypothetical protein